MTTPLQAKRRRNREFEALCGVPSKYTKPWDPPTAHPIAWALSAATTASTMPEEEAA